MIVSQFELVYKPQSPAGPADTVLQGYFLEVSNLEDKSYQFALKLTTSSITDADRSLFENAIVFVDTPGVNNSSGVYSLRGDLDDKSYSLNRNFTVPAHGTALIAILPSDPFPPSSVAAGSANFECRGYVTLTIPPVFTFADSSSFGSFRLTSQGSDPVKVLLTPQNRATYTDPTTGAPKGQTQSSVPISTGQSQNEITPLPAFLIERDFKPSLIGLSEQDAAQFENKLAAMLSVVAESELDLRSFNAALKKAEIGMAIETRKVK